MPRLICRKLLRQVVTFARSFDPPKADNSSPANTAMMAMTTSSSIRVNDGARNRQLRREATEGGSRTRVPLCYLGILSRAFSAFAVEHGLDLLQFLSR